METEKNGASNQSEVTDTLWQVYLLAHKVYYFMSRYMFLDSGIVWLVDW